MNRVHVVGTSGSGKSTVSGEIAHRLGIVHIELDALHWLPGWHERPRDQFRDRLRALLEQPRWVVDGNYDDLARDLVWERIDTLVWLDLPRSAVMRQILERTLRRWWRREVLWGTNRESLRKAFLSRDSVLWWAWSTHARRTKRYQRTLRDVPFRVVRLSSAAEIARWLSSLGA